jgi:hypothetical protein
MISAHLEVHDSDERASVDVLLSGAATLALFWDRLTDL